MLSFYYFRDMFNAIFLACWSELQESHQVELADSLEQALTTQNIPEITQTLLNLAEFMEHCEKVLFLYLLSPFSFCFFQNCQIYITILSQIMFKQWIFISLFTDYISYHRLLLMFFCKPILVGWFGYLSIRYNIVVCEKISP